MRFGRQSSAYRFGRPMLGCRCITLSYPGFPSASCRFSRRASRTWGRLLEKPLASGAALLPDQLKPGHHRVGDTGAARALPQAGFLYSRKAPEPGCSRTLKGPPSAGRRGNLAVALAAPTPADIHRPSNEAPGRTQDMARQCSQIHTQPLHRRVLYRVSVSHANDVTSSARAVATSVHDAAGSIGAASGPDKAE